MTLQELINHARAVADDSSQLSLWDDTLLTFYANEAQMEAARRARLFKDSSTDAICKYTVTAGTQSITLEPRVIFVRICKIDSQDLPLQRIHQIDIDKALPKWDAGSTDGDAVTHFVPDKDTGVIWFNAPFPTDDVVHLSVIREPLRPMRLQSVVVVGTATTTNTAIDPELRPRHHYGLVNWMLSRMLNMRDVEEKYDPKAADGYLALFEGEFGKKSAAFDETWIEREQMYDDADGTY